MVKWKRKERDQLLCRYIHGYGTITYCLLYVPATPGNQQLLRGYIHGYGTIVGMLLCMPHCSILTLILTFILSSKRAKLNCHLSFYNYQVFIIVGFQGYESCSRCPAMAMLEHTYFLRYFSPLVRMPQ
jgi:hypothetical protein